jgi:hypothetical protein
MPTSVQITGQLEISELHLSDSTHLQPAAFEQPAHRSPTMRAVRVHQEPAIRALATGRLDAFEFDCLIVVLND